MSALHRDDCDTEQCQREQPRAHNPSFGTIRLGAASGCGGARCGFGAATVATSSGSGTGTGSTGGTCGRRLRWEMVRH